MGRPDTPFGSVLPRRAGPSELDTRTSSASRWPAWKAWSTWEDAIAKRTDLSLKQIAVLLPNRTWAAIGKRRLKFGVNAIGPARPKWRPLEDALIRANMGLSIAALMTLLPMRSRSAIVTRRYTLLKGVVRLRAWLSSDQKLILAAPEDASDVELATTLRRTVCAVGA